MFKTIALLGRQPGLGIAELESLYGAESIQPFGEQACFVDIDACNIDFDRVGGSIRVGTVLMQLPSTKWPGIETLLINTAPQQASKVDGKLTFGLSVFGLSVSQKQVAKTALLMKKAIKTSGKSVRMVPHNDSPLNSATVLHNKLHKDGNWELVIVSDSKTAYLVQTFFVQDIDAYAARDQQRPKRDAKVGMLPPKLAQIIINLASDAIEVDDSKVCTPEELRRPLLGKTLLDPFCGTGVILQEASLMGYDVYGTDVNPRMIEYTEANLDWLGTETKRQTAVADATTNTWDTFDLIACETFLGQPLTNLPPADHLSKIMTEANAVNHKFLQNIAAQLQPGTKLCVAVPTWRGKREFLHLSALDYLDDLGYTRKTFKHVSNDDLIYHRPGQIVGRELLVLIKN